MTSRQWRTFLDSYLLKRTFKVLPPAAGGERLTQG